ncbi:MAG: DUF2380 domain-containing protein [Methylococcales bacterium]|nr:DUF2380 domain-containing protein [Methylococcaceae bacterium]
MNLLNFRILLLLVLLACHNVHAAQHIAVLDFELIDLTSLPNTAQEQQRTASIRPLLEQALVKKGDYDIVHINAQDQANANSSVGYLFRFDDLAAKLGEQHDADWVIVGRHSKPSFLFSYLMVHVIQVKTQTLVARFDIELKGNHEKVTGRGVNKLADKIAEFIDSKRQYPFQ